MCLEDITTFTSFQADPHNSLSATNNSGKRLLLKNKLLLQIRNLQRLSCSELKFTWKKKHYDVPFEIIRAVSLDRATPLARMNKTWSLEIVLLQLTFSKQMCMFGENLAQLICEISKSDKGLLKETALICAVCMLEKYFMPTSTASRINGKV